MTRGNQAFEVTRLLPLFVEMLGMAESPTKFATLDWIDQVDELGIIAGGMEDGAITLWNVKKILA